MANFSRLGTSTMYENTISTLGNQQKQLADQMEKMSSGKRVVRPSDDPVAAAQAERARTRLSRIEVDQRALADQTETIAYGESTLGQINSTLIEFRTLMLQAGNGSYSQVERDAVANQMESLRAQILNAANRKDSNGLPLFRGLDSQEKIIQGQYNFAGQPGQSGSSSEYGITSSLNGAMAFMSVASGNGVLDIRMGNPGSATPNSGTAWADVGTIRDPVAAAAAADAAKAGTPLSIQFKVDATTGDTTYTIDGGTTYQAFKTGQAITVGGMEVTVKGTPADGDGFTVGASQRSDVFSIMDAAIGAVRGAGSTGALQQGISKTVAEIDTAMSRISTVQGYAGDLLNQADRLKSTLTARDEQVSAQRSAAEDIDPIKGLSDLENMKTSVSVALQSYASIQKLSLFNFIN